MKPNLSIVKAILLFATALLILLAIIFSPVGNELKIIAATAGITVLVVMGILYYVFKKGDRHGK